MASDADAADFAVLAQKLLAVVIEHGDSGQDRDDGIVGGFVDPPIATHALVYCIAALNLHTVECETPKGQRELADNVRLSLRIMMKNMIENDSSPFGTVVKVPKT